MTGRSTQAKRRRLRFDFLMDKAFLDAKKNEGSQSTAWSVFSELVKLRLTTMVLITTLVGFYLGLDAESGGLAQNLAKLGLT